MMLNMNKEQLFHKWRLPYDWEIDDNGKWIHDANWQKHRLITLKIRTIKNKHNKKMLIN